MTTQKRFEFLKLKLTEELVAILVEETGFDINKAFDILYKSQTYAKLSDPNTKLYIQSAGYVYSVLEDELSMKN
ncbi:MAG: hypothetical protein IKZ99_03570 [Salinivirgaceae bacterium]|nr:hypothetical protein [Salinivirgaceae bacterium]